MKSVQNDEGEKRCLYTVQYHGVTTLVYSPACVAGVYLINFFTWNQNLSYTPCI